MLFPPCPVPPTRLQALTNMVAGLIHHRVTETQRKHRKARAFDLSESGVTGDGKLETRNLKLLLLPRRVVSLAGAHLVLLVVGHDLDLAVRSEEHTSELQS